MNTKVHMVNFRIQENADQNNSNTGAFHALLVLIYSTQFDLEKGVTNLLNSKIPLKQISSRNTVNEYFVFSKYNLAFHIFTLNYLQYTYFLSVNLLISRQFPYW